MAIGINPNHTKTETLTNIPHQQLSPLFVATNHPTYKEPPER